MWILIAKAPKDGRPIDSLNIRNNERRVTRWDEDWPGLSGVKWRGWDGQWGNSPTHFMHIERAGVLGLT